MKKVLVLTVMTMMFAGCAMVAPVLRVDWTGVNSSDLDNLQSGKITLAAVAVTEAAGEVLKGEGFKLEAPAPDAVITVKKHGVTFYGSCDYALSCKVTQEAGFSKLSWYMISYVSQFLTNTDAVSRESADGWNLAVYRKLLEKGLITKEKKPEVIAVPAAENAAAPAVKDTDLPAPPREE
jgi:hypothetical protein